MLSVCIHTSRRALPLDDRSAIDYFFMRQGEISHTRRVAMRVKLRTTVPHLAGAITLLAALVISSHAQERDRSKIAEQYKWDLNALFPSDQVWRSSKDKLVTELTKLREFQGTLASSPQRLADALEARSRLGKA